MNQEAQTSKKAQKATYSLKTSLLTKNQQKSKLIQVVYFIALVYLLLVLVTLLL